MFKRLKHILSSKPISKLVNGGIYSLIRCLLGNCSESRVQSHLLYKCVSFRKFSCTFCICLYETNLRLEWSFLGLFYGSLLTSLLFLARVGNVSCVVLNSCLIVLLLVLWRLSSELVFNFHEELFQKYLFLWNHYNC